MKEFHRINCKFMVEDQVIDFVAKTQIKTLNPFVGQVFSLLEKLPVQIKYDEVNKIAHMGLQILINITCISANTSIYLGSKPNFLKSILRLFEIVPNDAAWLMSHVFLDGPVNLSQLIQSRIFSKFADSLN